MPTEIISRSPVALAVVIIAVIGVFASLYLARGFFVPLLIGILGSYALRPFVNWLKVWHIPPVAGAALVLAALVSALFWVGFSLKDDVVSIVEKLPEAARKVRQHVIDGQQNGPTTLQKIQEAATEIQGAATDATGTTAPVGSPQLQGASARKPSKAATSTAAPPPGSSAWIQNYLLAQSALLFSVAAQAPIVILLTYFLLASGVHFRRKLVHFVGPSFTRKKDVVRILDEIDVQIQRFLLATVGANILLGIATWLTFEALGVKWAGALGVTAGILHFIPYLGSILFAVLCGMAAFMQFETVASALGIATVSLLIAMSIGTLAMTWLQSRYSRINAAVLFIALLFFGWLWGVWGLLLGAPLVAIAKVVCDRVDELNPLGELLGQ